MSKPPEPDKNESDAKQPRPAKIGMRTFGASAPLQELQKKFGFEPEHVVQAARDQIARSRG